MKPLANPQSWQGRKAGVAAQLAWPRSWRGRSRSWRGRSRSWRGRAAQLGVPALARAHESAPLLRVPALVRVPALLQVPAPETPRRHHITCKTRPRNQKSMLTPCAARSYAQARYVVVIIHGSARVRPFCGTYMWACAPAHMCTCAHVNMCTCVNTCAYVRTCVNVCAHLCTN